METEKNIIHDSIECLVDESVKASEDQFKSTQGACYDEVDDE